MMGDSVLVLTIAAELAVKRGDVKGPGTFLPGLIDSLWHLEPELIQTMAMLSIE